MMAFVSPTLPLTAPRALPTLSASRPRPHFRASATAPSQATLPPRVTPTPLPNVLVYDHCPFCARVRLALGLKNVKHNLTWLLNDDVATPTSLVGRKIVPIFQPLGSEGPAQLESLDIIAALDSDERYGTPGLFRPSSGRTDIDAVMDDIAMPLRRLTRPRFAMAPLPEFAFHDAKDAYIVNHPLKDPDSYDENFSRSDEWVAQVNARLGDLEKLIYSNECCTEGGVGYDDIELFPKLRSMTIIKGIQLPKGVRDYMECLAERAEDDLPKLARAACRFCSAECSTDLNKSWYVAGLGTSPTRYLSSFTTISELNRKGRSPPKPMFTVAKRSRGRTKGRKKKELVADVTKRLGDFPEVQRASPKDLHYAGGGSGQLRNEHIVVTPMNLSPSPDSAMALCRYRYVKEYEKLLNGDGLWDDGRQNKAEVGDLFGFVFYQPSQRQDRMELFEITEILSADHRRDKLIAEKDKKRQVVKLSKYLGKISYSAFAAAKRTKLNSRKRFPAVRDTVRTEWPTQVEVNLQGYVKRSVREDEKVVSDSEEEDEEGDESEDGDYDEDGDYGEEWSEGDREEEGKIEIIESVGETVVKEEDEVEGVRFEEEWEGRRKKRKLM